MNHYGYQHPQAPNDVLCHSTNIDRSGYEDARTNGHMNVWPRFGATNPRSGYEGVNNDKNENGKNTNINPAFGGFLSSVKRQRESHVILSSSQDDDGYNCCEDQCENDIASMGHYKDPAGPTKRQRLAYAFPFDNDGRIITRQLQEPIAPGNKDSTMVEDGVEMALSNRHERTPPVEWWRKKRPPVTSAIPADTAGASSPRSIVEQEALSACSAMDTTDSDNEICCHVCQNFFPLPTVPTVRDVMPPNALLNYFSPLKKTPNSNGDVVMMTQEDAPHCISRTTRSSHPCAKSLASCPCCDRPTCPECRKTCQACQRSFCVFCSITRDDGFAHDTNSAGTFCLDCYDRS